MPGSNWNLELLVFEKRGKPEYLEKKRLRAEKKTNNKLNPQMTPGPRIEPETHWWEASALRHPYYGVISNKGQAIEEDVVFIVVYALAVPTREPVNFTEERITPASFSQ